MKIILTAEQEDKIYEKSKNCKTCKKILDNIYCSKENGSVIYTNINKKFWTKEIIEYLKSII